MLVQKYDYEKLSREKIQGKRHYLLPDGSKVPSVTTILAATKPKKDREMLENWQKRVGFKEAERIRVEAADRGELMHSYLEDYIHERLTEQDNQSYKMAEVVIENGLKHVDEVWGTEASLYHTGLYAGATDCVGLWQNNPCIVDFKQSNKPKRDEWVRDYKMQIIAYSEAHNHMFGTNIKRGVILMCSKDLKYQQWVIRGPEYKYYEKLWWKRVEQYHLS